MNEENKSPNVKASKDTYLLLDAKFSNGPVIKKEISIEEIFSILKVDKIIYKINNFFIQDLSNYLESARVLDITYIKEENKINIINFLSSVEENKFFSIGINEENFEATKLLITSFTEFLNTLAPEESFEKATLRVIKFLIYILVLFKTDSCVSYKFLWF